MTENQLSAERKAIRQQVASDLLEIGAVFLRPDEPFTWASGIKSPIYCDNRLILSAPAVRSRVERALADTALALFPDTQTLMGTATAGIAHAALAAALLDLPMGYVRGGAKGHGRGNQIEGRYEPGDRVVVIEDLISTGGSSVEAANALVDAGLDVQGVLAIFSYNMARATQTFAEAGFSYAALTDLDTLVQVAEQQGYLTAEQAPEVLRFRDDPANWWTDKLVEGAL